MSSAENPQKPLLFYGWYILAASFVILFFTTGARYTIGVVFKPLMAEFGWDRGAVSLAFFINMTLFAVSLIATGRAYDRYGPKWVIAVSTCFLSFGFMALAIVKSLSQFFIFYSLIAAVGMGGTTIPLFAALMSKWFEKNRGLGISLGLAGSCIGQFILVPAFTAFVIRYGWRISYFFLGLVMLIVILTLAFFVIKGDPKNLGLKPWGHACTAIPVEEENQRILEPEFSDLGLKDAMKTRSFWLFLMVMFVCGSGDFLVTTHLIPMVTDYHISQTAAGHMLAWLGLMGLPGILVAGPLSDRIGTKIPIALTFLLRFFLFLQIMKYQGTASFYFFACAFGFTLLITAPLNAVLIGKLYGFSHVGLITGFITTVHHLGGGFWAYMGGEIFDRSGSYHMAFVFSAVMAVAAVFFTLLIKERRHVIQR